MIKHNRQRGVALISVMLIVALAAIIATQMTTRLQVELQRNANIEFNQQAYWYAIGAEAFTKRVLTESVKKDPDITHLGQIWAQGETTYPVEFGQITGEITDLQACFNLNSLRPDQSTTPGVSPPTTSGSNKPQAQQTLERLIISLGVEGISNFEAEYMVDALTDWLDQDTSIASAGGAEDNDYAGREFPYLTANHFLASVNELRVIEHFTVPVINALRPYVCTLPYNQNTININTLKPEQSKLLAAAFDGISESDAQELINDRPEQGYSGGPTFFTAPVFAKKSPTNTERGQIVFDSNFFNLKTTTRFNTSFFTMNSMMMVSGNNRVDVISRRIGRE